MRESEEFRRQIFQILKLTIFLTFLVLLCETTATNAQETNTTGTDGWTPPGIAPGSPAGSYPLSGFETVNLYNGSLNFRLPLVQILGRGSAQTAVHLPPLSTKWRINHFYHYEKGPPLKIDESYSPLQDWWSTVPWFAPGSLEGRTVGKDGPVDCTTLSRSAITLTRLTFTSADGTEYELRDARTGGESKFVICTDTYPSAPVGFDRGTVFVTADGSSATFIADNPIIDDYTAAGGQQGIISVAGYLYLRDGTRYRISAADQAPPYNIPGGAVTEMRDRNGNIVTFTYIGGNLSSITDSVGRTVTFQYGAPDLNFSLCRTEGQCDEITFSGVGGASRTIYIVFAYLASALRQTQTYDASQAATNGTLFPDLTPIHASVASLIVNPSKVASVWLPGNSPDDLNGHTLHYQFFYNVYGELARVELPTGGAIEYDHAGVLVSTFTGQGGGGRQVLRKVVERRVYPNLQTQVPELKTTYTYAESPAPQGQVTNTSMSEMDQFDAESHPLASEIHYFFGAPALDLFNNGNEADPLSYPPWKQSKEYQTDLGSPLLKRQTNTWNQQPPSWWSMVSPDLAPANNPVIVETDTTLDDGQTSKQLFFYDKYNNRTDISEYDYGSTTPERHTHICYLINGNDCNVSAGLPGNSGYFYDTVNPPNSGSPDPNATIHLRSLPARQFVYDRSGSLQSMTKFEYDSYTEGISSTNAVQHGSIFTTNYLSRGNLTATMQCLGTPPLDQNNCPTWLTTRNQYNDAGNVVKTTDPRTNFTTFDYTDSWGNDTCKPSSGSAAAYVKKVTNALEQVTSYTYDSCTGKPISITDPNNQETDYAYDDLLDRLKTVTFPLVPVGQNSYHPTTVYTYNDNALNVVTARDLNSSGDGVIKTKSVYDGLARVIQTQLMSDPQGIVYADTTYDALGRKHTVSNPYRSTSDETYGMTTFGYDGLSRVKTTETTDRFNASTGVVTTDYYGNTTTVTDQAGKPRRSLTDALGRLIRVDEPDKTTGVLGDVNSPVQPTSYTYDALDDLTTVIQGQQTRYFMYDSLKRLVRAKNPEQDVNASLNLLDLVTGNRQWSQGYSYDGNGNLLTKTDTRGITTTYTYDALNRVGTKTYSDSTPGVTYTYDDSSVSNSKGRLTQVNSSVSITDFKSYDGMGRVAESWQTTGSQTYKMYYGYNLAGGMTSEKYPSGRIITTGYDAAGRINGVTGSGNNTYASSFSYWPHGAMKVMKLGSATNPLWQHAEYGSRLQPTEIGLGTSGTDSSVLKLAYSYNTTGQNDNNGNVLTQTISVGATSMNQKYEYDALNRLKKIGENNDLWWYTYQYDQYGNRTGGQRSDSPFLPPLLIPGMDHTKNRISDTNYVYDNAGNLTHEPITNGQYSYDAENRMLSASKNTASGTYSYDGDGRRVIKAAGGVTSIFVYDATGKLAAEYSTGAPAAIGTSFLTTDHLGSTRVVTDATGAVISRHDYLPFGETIPAGVGGRTAVMGYEDPDGINQKFTGKERDSESELDYFGARYFTGAQGRFTSLDPTVMTRQRINDPQQWNLYTYTRNNPLKYIDPDGNELKIAIRNDSGYSNDVVRNAAEHMAAKFRTAGVKVVTIEIQRGRVSDTENLISGFTKTDYLEIRKNKEGSGGFLGTPDIRSTEGGHNFNLLGGLSAIDTSMIGGLTNDPEKAAMAIANLSAHEIGHDVETFHTSGDPIMGGIADKPEWLFNDNQFGSELAKALQNKFNKPGEKAATTIVVKEDNGKEDK